MNRFRPELFDKDDRTYIYKRSDSTIYDELNIKKHMTSNDNIDLLSRRMIQQLDMDTSLTYKQVKEKIIKFINSWLNLGKLDDERVLGEILQHNKNVAINHLNQLFLDTFKEHFYEVKDYFKEDLNPFKVTKEGKLHANMYVDDIRALNVQSQNQLISVNQQFLVRDNKVPHYQNLSKGRHYERENNEGLNSSGYDKIAPLYKSYGDSSMKELLKYEDFNTPFQYLPFSEDNHDM